MTIIVISNGEEMSWGRCVMGVYVIHYKIIQYKEKWKNFNEILN